MCGRFTYTRGEVDDLARELSAQVERDLLLTRESPSTARPSSERAERDEPLLWRPRYNVAPAQPHWILRLQGGRRVLTPARFGLTRREGGLHVNARSEGAARSRRFGRAFAEARCLVPVDGFYEWRREGGQARPFWLHRRDGALLLLAALWEEPGRDQPRAFTILTAAASAEVAPLHDRMPVLVQPASAERWLTAGDEDLLRPAPDGTLAVDPVSPLVNSATSDGPELLRPPPPERQLTLL